MAPSRESDAPESKPLKTRYCFPDAAGSYTEAVAVERGHDNSGDYDWAQGGACIFRPIQNVWSVFQNHQLMMWGGVTSMRASERTDVPAGVARFFSIQYFVDNSWPLPDVDWTMDWYHTVTAGNSGEPLQILINYGKVRGTSYIRRWEGTIYLDALSPTVTSISMRDQVNAAQTGPEDSESGIRDVIRKLRTGSP